MTDSVHNIILLTIDALRADHLSCHGYDRETTPHLDRFADRNVHFTRAYSASSHTREAVPAFLTGRYPDDAIDERYHLDAPSVATVLSDEGYATGGFHSNPYLSRAYGFDKGFDEFDDDLHIGHHKLIALAQRFVDKLRNRHYARAPEINERALRWIDSLPEGRPFFLWNHYMDVHGPYDPPAESPFTEDRSISSEEAQDLYQKSLESPKKITDGEQKRLCDAYDAEVEYFDACLQNFLAAVASRGLSDTSLVIVVADHGDAFGEHGHYGHPRFLYEELLRVPLIFSYPTQTDLTVNDPVSTVGIVPTILESIGVSDERVQKSPLLTRQGDISKLPETVFASATGEDEHSDRRRFGAWEGQRKVIMERTIDDGSVLSMAGFDLEADPGGHRTITDLSGAFEQLREHVFSFSSRQLSMRSAASVTDSEVEERLEALGYK